MGEMGRRKTPPETEDEHAYIWDSAEKAQKAWRIAGPIHAAVTNWRGWATIGGIFVAVNGNKIVPSMIEFLEKFK